MMVVDRSRCIAACIALLSLLFLFHSPAPLRVQSAAEVDPLVYLMAVETGGKPDALAVDACPGRNEVIFYDRNSSNVRFLDAASLSFLPETLNLPTSNDKRWIAYDRGLCLAYVVTTRYLSYSTYYWYEARVHVLDSRVVTSTFSVNDVYNTSLTNWPDRGYVVDGVALKQSNSEAGNPVRLVLDNTRKGQIDVVDLNPAGNAIARNQRFTYDDRGVLSTWGSNLGNSLALETKHETLAVDDLTAVDHLYIADRNHAPSPGRGYIRTVRLNHPLQDLNAALLSEIDLNGMTPPYFYQGPQGIALAGPRDRLYVASATVSFSTGRVAQVRTTNHALIQNIDLNYEDAGKVLADWYDPRLVFVATSDYFSTPTPSLYLHLIDDATVVDTLKVLTPYDRSTKPLKSMAFDPYTRRLYLAVGSQILVVQVNYGSVPPPPVIENPIYLPVIRK